MLRPSTKAGWTSTVQAVVEVTSEEKEYPVESALVSGEMRGWRAADSGTQTIRLIFDQPQSLRRISLALKKTK
jgi:hypothetical protein